MDTLLIDPAWTRILVGLLNIRAEKNMRKQLCNLEHIAYSNCFSFSTIKISSGYRHSCGVEKKKDLTSALFYRFIFPHGLHIIASGSCCSSQFRQKGAPETSHCLSGVLPHKTIQSGHKYMWHMWLYVLLYVNYSLCNQKTKQKTYIQDRPHSRIIIENLELY